MKYKKGDVVQIKELVESTYRYYVITLIPPTLPQVYVMQNLITGVKGPYETYNIDELTELVLDVSPKMIRLLYG